MAKRRTQKSAAQLLHLERLKASATTHGLAASATYRSWAQMKDRCRNPKNPRWKDYGGRGITVCERWLKFENFLADLGIRPPKTTLERRQTDGNYEPGNCCWATAEAQQNNMRSNVRIAHLGRTQTLPRWAREFSLNQTTLRKRLARGWSIERALQQPRYRRPDMKKKPRQLLTITEVICKRCGHRWLPRKPNPTTCAMCKMDPTTERIRKSGGGRKARAIA